MWKRANEKEQKRKEKNHEMASRKEILRTKAADRAQAPEQALGDWTQNYREGKCNDPRP